MYIDMIDYETAGGLVAMKLGAQRRQVYLVGRFTDIAAVDVSMQGGKLAHHLPDHIIDLFAIGGTVYDGEIACAHSLPVDPLHAPIVKIVALEAPSVLKEAAKLGPRVGSEGPMRKIDCGLCKFLGVAQGG